MNSYPILSKAPIILAILELKFKAPDSVTLQSLAPLKSSLKEEFPHHSTRNKAEIKVNPNDEFTKFSVNNTSDAFRFVSESNKHEFVISVDTFTFSQHGAYDTWDEFKKRAMDVWAKCSRIVEPILFERISIRYINNIEIPYPIDSIQPAQNFFNTFISYVGRGDGKPISNYFLKYTNPPNPEEKITVHFAQELKLGQDSKFPFIIDIDVLYNGNEHMTIDEVKKKFDHLRQIKNEYFFNNLTESTFNLVK